MIADFSHCEACTVDQYCAKKFRCQFHFADADLPLPGRKLDPDEAQKFIEENYGNLLRRLSNEET